MFSVMLDLCRSALLLGLSHDMDEEDHKLIHELHDRRMQAFVKAGMEMDHWNVWLAVWILVVVGYTCWTAFQMILDVIGIKDWTPDTESWVK